MVVCLVVAACSCGAAVCWAGKAMNWEEVPEAVRATILANGGKVGPVDKEREKLEGKALYEARGKDQHGKEVDLEITEDGRLAMTKDDDPAERTPDGAGARKPLVPLKFTHPREVTNSFLPLASLQQDVLEGTEGGTKVRIERTAKPGVRKRFKLGDQVIDALVVEDREFEDGELAEVTLDYFAQADDGTVLYLGEKVDEFKHGKVTGHSGAWMLGKETKVPGVILPSSPGVGDKFRSEDVPRITTEDDEVVAVGETVTVPAGTYRDCLKVKESLSDGKTEYKYYARGVGVVKEVPQEGEVVLQSHTTRP